MSGARPVLPAVLLAAALFAAGGPGGAAVQEALGGTGEEPAPGEPGMFRLYEATAAAVNGEVLFLSDVVRRACLLRCGAFPGDEPAELPPAEVRDGMIREVLVLQEEAKLGLGEVDDAALRDGTAAALSRMQACASPCAGEVGPDEVREYVRRRLISREFLRKRVSVFVEVTDEEVQREIQRRTSREGAAPDSLAPERVRRELFEEKAAREIRNWLDRVTSKSRIVPSPLEEE